MPPTSLDSRDVMEKGCRESSRSDRHGPRTATFEMRFPSRLWILRSFLLAVIGLLPEAVLGQTGWFIEPSLSVIHMHDDNIFYDDIEPEDDRITRASPAIYTGYHSSRTNLSARYSVDAERYRVHSELDSDNAREYGELDYSQEAGSLLTLSANSTYIETRTPGELAPDTGLGLELGRATAKRVTFSPAAVYRLSPVTVGSTRYSFVRDELDGGIDSDIHTLSQDFDRRLNRRDILSYGYRYEQFEFGVQEPFDAHTVLFGGTRRLTSNTAVTLIGGVRYAEDSLDPDVTASVFHEFDSGSLEVSYERRETTLIGLSGTATTQGLTGTFVQAFGESTEIRLSSSAYTNRLGDQVADAYMVNFEATYQLARYLTLVGAYGYNSQRGGLEDVFVDDIERNRAWIGFVIAAPAREDPPTRRQGKRISPIGRDEMEPGGQTELPEVDER